MAKTIGERIRELRNEHGLTQKELGMRAGIAEPTIRRYELGKLNPKVETVRKIAAALGVSWAELYPEEQRADAIKYTMLQGLNGADEKETPAYTPLNDNLRKMEQLLKQMTDEGQRVAVERVEEMTQLPKYRLPTE